MQACAGIVGQCGSRILAITDTVRSGRVLGQQPRLMPSRDGQRSGGSDGGRSAQLTMMATPGSRGRADDRRLVARQRIPDCEGINTMPSVGGRGQCPSFSGTESERRDLVLFSGGTCRRGSARLFPWLTRLETHRSG